MSLSEVITLALDTKCMLHCLLLHPDIQIDAECLSCKTSHVSPSAIDTLLTIEKLLNTFLISSSSTIES